MKVLYITNALTHYYNLVLSKLNQEDDIELICLAPKGNNSYQVGAGVKLTNEGINFKVIALEEKRRFYLYFTFKGLAKTIADERPDIVVVLGATLPAFLFDFSLRRVVRLYKIAIILKDHPFRLLSYPEALQAIDNSNRTFNSLPSLINKIISMLRVDRVLSRVQLEIKRRSLLLPDAHVNYIDASDILSSYGVDREKIFITRNSPDTDSLFATKEEIKTLPIILPENPYRLIHVGRLVTWKRVDMLINAFATVQQMYSSAELLVIGTGPEEERLKQIVMQLGLGESVKFLGGVYEQTQLGQYLIESSLYVLAGMGGLSINDAMCFGLPILCSVCDGTEYFLVREGQNGRYFIDSDEEDLTKKIVWFFENLEKAENMGAVSERIIMDEVNVHTVIDGYKDAFGYVMEKLN
jgi:glycosyltransferase involved in cell wall biosynthesis